MSKSHRRNDADNKIHRVGKTVKRSLDKYPGMIYNMTSFEDYLNEVNEDLLEELYYEEKLKYNANTAHINNTGDTKNVI